MRFLLPPSETKAPGGNGPPLDLDLLAFPTLTAIRLEIVTALSDLAADPERARAVLGISSRQDEEIARNRILKTSATRPAIERYSGVLYEALGAEALPRRARTRAARTVVITSALFGALGADDPIPAYRLSGTADLPNVGKLSRRWRPDLAGVLASQAPVIDLRSAAYVALAPLPTAIRVRVIDRDGRSISHHNKAAKGRLVRAFLQCPRQPRRIDDLASAAAGPGLHLHRLGPTEIELRWNEGALS